MFKVVLFLESEEVEVVPASWVLERDGESVCYWPPYTRSSDFLKAVRQLKPREENMGSHKVHCLYETGKCKISDSIPITYFYFAIQKYWMY